MVVVADERRFVSVEIPKVISTGLAAIIINRLWTQTLSINVISFG